MRFALFSAVLAFAGGCAWEPASREAGRIAGAGVGLPGVH
jgi:hypothetical protein